MHFAEVFHLIREKMKKNLKNDNETCEAYTSQVILTFDYKRQNLNTVTRLAQTFLQAEGSYLALT